MIKTQNNNMKYFIVRTTLNRNYIISIVNETEIKEKIALYRNTCGFEVSDISIDTFFNGCNTLEEKLDKFLNNVNIAVADYGICNDTLTITIEWGDWKHDHIAIEQFIKDVFGFECIYEKVTEEDGCDCYSSEHYFKIGGVANA